MNQIVEAIVAILGGIMLVALLAVFSGTVLFWIWPIAVPAAFPGLVAAGVIGAKMTWWGAVCLTWVAGILVKSNLTTKK